MNKSDWKLFQTLLPQWQEVYTVRLCDEYASILTGPYLCNLARRLALYQVSVRRLLDFATPLPPLLPLPSSACGSLHLAVNTRDRTSTG